jgi:hypothetical protein
VKPDADQSDNYLTERSIVSISGKISQIGHPEHFRFNFFAFINALAQLLLCIQRSLKLTSQTCFIRQ